MELTVIASIHVTVHRFSSTRTRDSEADRSLHTTAGTAPTRRIKRPAKLAWNMYESRTSGGFARSHRNSR